MGCHDFVFTYDTLTIFVKMFTPDIARLHRTIRNTYGLLEINVRGKLAYGR